MAAYAATYFESGRSSSRRIEERNARLFAEQQRLRRGATLEVFSTTRAWSRLRTRFAFARCAFLLPQSRSFFRWSCFTDCSTSAPSKWATAWRPRRRRLRHCASRIASFVWLRRSSRSRGVSTLWRGRWAWLHCSRIKLCGLRIESTRAAAHRPWRR